jgi:hypothetical protein
MISVEMRPSGIAAAASAPGRTFHGWSAARANALGDDIPGHDPRGRAGFADPGRRAASLRAAMRRPSADTGPSVERAARSGAESPARRSAPTMDPADVPTITSASRASQPVTSASPASTPAWNAWPTAPPAPSTSPIRVTAT